MRGRELHDEGLVHTRHYVADGRNDGLVNIDLDPSDLDRNEDAVIRRERERAIREMRDLYAWKNAQADAKTILGARRLFRAYLDGMEEGLRTQLRTMRRDLARLREEEG